ncbi:ABC transporter permease [Paracoccus sp. PAMC 22219]|uniref:ABC transporter permease n=1 Tax=Paracoccus sp. PAMC 22219 TaxID=1569209 RepID=UPI000A6386DD|nr:ABC transporter permease [Paracoccus sp. PAMC 22219]
MIVYLVRRVGQSLLAVMAMAVLVFIGVFFIGNPVDVLVSPEASQAQIAATVERLGLDRPLYEQFGIFVWNALQGDLGTSFVYGRPALEIILDRLPATLELALVALALSVGIGIPLGVWAGLRPDSIAGRTIMGARSWGSRCPISGRACC